MAILDFRPPRLQQVPWAPAPVLRTSITTVLPSTAGGPSPPGAWCHRTPPAGHAISEAKAHRGPQIAHVEPPPLSNRSRAYQPWPGTGPHLPSPGVSSLMSFFWPPTPPSQLHAGPLPFLLLKMLSPPLLTWLLLLPIQVCTQTSPFKTLPRHPGLLTLLCRQIGLPSPESKLPEGRELTPCSAASPAYRSAPEPFSAINTNICGLSLSWLSPW